MSRQRVVNPDLVKLAIYLLSLALLIAGWQHFLLLLDDAFITFRYVRNSLNGYGLVWNLPPFQPVEGYTSFLWAIVLKTVWQTLGISPVVSANLLSLTCAATSLIATGVVIERTVQHHQSSMPGHWKLLILSLSLLFLACNPSFLFWSGSGLETALFNLLILLWAITLINLTQPNSKSLFLLSLFAALIYLARPDGLLMVGATASLIVFSFIAHRKQGVFSSRSLLISLLPLLLVIAHIVWRIHFYGAWLPNTYSAKVTSPWPAAGIRYLFAFIMEYGLWFWLMVIAVTIFWKKGSSFRFPGHSVTIFSLPLSLIARICLFLTLGAHIAYYTLIVGGDHFEYRIYSYLLPLIVLGIVTLLCRTLLRPLVITFLLLAGFLLSLPVPWTIEAQKKHVPSHALHSIAIPISDHWPNSLHWYTRTYDQLQSWLVSRYIGIRHLEHQRNADYLMQLFNQPYRDEAPDDGMDVLPFPAVGIAGWRLPDVAIIDLHGLNDKVIARQPVATGQLRHMAHEKQPPEGYIECFKPNVAIYNGQIIAHRRAQPLTPQDIRACESRWLAKQQEQETP